MTAHAASCDGFEYVGRNSGRTLNPDDDSIDCRGACLDARPHDDMTCARCGGHFQRWEGIDDPEPTCPWCLVDRRFNA